MIGDVVEDDVEALWSAGEIVAGVVDHRVGADRLDQAGVPGAARAGHLGTEHFGDLDRERAEAAGRAVDQDLLPGLHPGLVPQRLQGGTAATGTDAACSKVTVAGFGTTLSRGTPGHLRAAQATGGGFGKLPCCSCHYGPVLCSRLAWLHAWAQESPAGIREHASN